MCDPALLLIHQIVTIARLVGPRGARSILAESQLVKHQLLIVNRSRERAPNLRLWIESLQGFCTMTDGNPAAAACTSYLSPRDHEFATHSVESRLESSNSNEAFRIYRTSHG